MSTTQPDLTVTETRIHSAILRLGDRCCSVPVDNIREMAVLPEVKELCGTADYIPGVITLRGQAIPVVDLRMRLGMVSILDENRSLLSTLEDLERVHTDWYEQLKSSIESGTSTRATIDASQSQLGKWLNTFKGHTREITHLLAGFEPHLTAVYAAAAEAQKLAHSGQTEAASKLTLQVHHSEMHAISLQFERLFNLLSVPPRMIVTVIEVESEFIGLIVDEVAGLAWVRSENGDISKEASRIDQLFASMGRNESNSHVVSMLDPKGLRVHHAA